MTTQTQHLTRIAHLVLDELNRCYPNLVIHNQTLQTHIINNTRFELDLEIEIFDILDNQVKNHNQFSNNEGLIAQLDKLFLQVDETHSQKRQSALDKQNADWDKLANGLEDDDDMSFLDELEGEEAEEVKDLFNMLDDMEEQAKNAKPVAIAYAQSHKNSLHNVLTLLDMLYPLDTMMTTTLINDDYFKKLSYGDWHPIRYGLRKENTQSGDIIEQAEAIYNQILALPDRYEVMDGFGFVEKGKQAAQGQFWLIALMTPLLGKLIDDDALNQWLLNKLETAPDKLFMFSYELTGHPAFWWAKMVEQAPLSPLKSVLRTKDDLSLQTALDRVENEQAITEKMSAVSVKTNDGKAGQIAITPLADVGFSAAQNTLIDTLNQFTEVLQKHFKDLELRTVTDIDINAIEQALAPLQFAEDIRVFYHWSLQFDDIEKFFVFPRIENLSESYRFSLETMQESFVHWSKVLFSFAYESQVHLITPLSETSAVSQAIYYYEIVGGDFEGYFDSVLAMIKTYIEAYETNLFDTEKDHGCAYLVDDEDDASYDKWNTIRLKHNPNAYNSDDDSSRTATNYIEYWEVDTWSEEWKKYQIGEVGEY